MHASTTGRGLRCLALATFAFCLLVPAVSRAGWKVGSKYTLFEYYDPRFARTGVLIELKQTGGGRTAYGYPFAARMKIRRRCARSLSGGTFLNGGTVVAWVGGYANGPFPEDPYAYTRVVFPYGASRRDGSSGTDLDCVDKKHPREGYLWLYARYEQYWYYDKVYGYHVGDLLDYSTALGHHWYKVYSGKPAQDFLRSPLVVPEAER